MSIEKKARDLTRAGSVQCPCCGALLAIAAVDISNQDRRVIARAVLERRLSLQSIEDAEEDARLHLARGGGVFELEGES